LSWAARPSAIRILSNRRLSPREQAAEVVASSGEHGIDSVTAGVGEVIAALMFLEVADDRLDGNTPFELALDLRVRRRF
jgi:hypothetical protein